MKILITGALGHIGSHLLRELPNYFDKLSITLFDNLSTQRYPVLFNLPSQVKYDFYPENIIDHPLEDYLSHCDCAIHLAATTDAASSFNDPEGVKSNNTLSTKAIADACLKTDIPLLFPSTTSVYGTQQSQVDETCEISELKPQSPYAESKLEEEKYLENLSQTKGLRVVICRFGTIYGFSLGMRFHTAVNKFCWQAVLKQPLTVWETAYQQKRPYLDLKDATSAISFFIKNNLFDGKVYNVVTGNHTVEDVTNVIKSFIPDLSIKFVSEKIMNQLSYEVIPKRLNDLDFKWQGDLTTGINHTITTLQQMKSSSRE